MKQSQQDQEIEITHATLLTDPNQLQERGKEHKHQPPNSKLKHIVTSQENKNDQQAPPSILLSQDNESFVPDTQQSKRKLDDDEEPQPESPKKQRSLPSSQDLQPKNVESMALSPEKRKLSLDPSSSKKQKVIGNESGDDSKYGNNSKTTHGYKHQVVIQEKSNDKTAEVLYIADFLGPEEQEALEIEIDTLIALGHFKAEENVIMGKFVPADRKVMFAADKDCEYFYNGKYHPAIDFTPQLLKVRRKMQEVTGHAITNLALNLYQNGSVGIGNHFDNIQEGIAPDSTIATTSLGETRDMTFTRRYAQPGSKEVPVTLQAGSLLLMQKQTQDLFLHSIKKDETQGRRISVTGRWIFPSKGKKGVSELEEKNLKKEVKAMNEKLRIVVEAERRLKEEMKKLRLQLQDAKQKGFHDEKTIKELRKALEHKKTEPIRPPSHTKSRWERKLPPRGPQAGRNDPQQPPRGYLPVDISRSQQVGRNDPWQAPKGYLPTRNPLPQYMPPGNPPRFRTFPLDNAIDPTKYRTNTLIIKGISSLESPSLEWVQKQFANTGLFDDLKEVKQVTQFTTKMGTKLIKLTLQDEESVTKILRKKKLLRNAGNKFQHVFVFPHRPRVIRELSLTRSHQRYGNRNIYEPKPFRTYQRFIPMRELESYHGNVNNNPLNFNEQNHLNGEQHQRGWNDPRHRW